MPQYMSVVIPLVLLILVIAYLAWREKVRQRRREENRARWRNQTASRPANPPPAPPKAPVRESRVIHRHEDPPAVYDPLSPLSPISPISPFNDSYRQDPSPSDYTCRDVGYGGGTGDSSPSSCDSPSTSSFD